MDKTDTQSVVEPDNEKALKDIRQMVRPNWLDSENKIFINKLNFVCENYEKCHNDVKKLKGTVNKKYALELDDLFNKQKVLNDDYQMTKEKVNTQQQSLPKLINEIVTYQIDLRLGGVLEKFMTKSDFQNALSYKLDTASFNDYKKRQLAADMTDMKEYQLNDRFYNLEKRIEGFISPERFKSELSQLAKQDSFSDLKRLVETVEKSTKANKDQSLDNYERLDKIQKDMKEENYDRNQEFKSLIHSLDTKVQSLEEWKEAGGAKQGESESSEDEENSQTNLSVSQGSKNKLQKQESISETPSKQKEQSEKNGDSINGNSRLSSVPKTDDQAQSKREDCNQLEPIEINTKEKTHSAKSLISKKSIIKADIENGELKEVKEEEAKSVKETPTVEKLKENSLSLISKKSEKKKEEQDSSPVTSPKVDSIKQKNQDLELLSMSKSQKRQVDSPEVQKEAEAIKEATIQLSVNEKVVEIKEPELPIQNSRQIQKGDENRGTLLLENQNSQDLTKNTALMDELKNTANERETRVSTVLREESPKKIIEKDASPAPITPIPNSPDPTVSPVSISPTTKVVKEKSNNGRSDAPTPGLSVKTKKSIRKTVKKSEKDGGINRDETGDSSLNQIDKIDLMAESKYKDSVSPSKSPRTSLKKKSIKNDELTIKLTEQANEFKNEISDIKQEQSRQKVAFQKVLDELHDFNNMTLSEKQDKKQNQIIKKAFIEFMTPIEMNINVDFKKLRKYIEDCMTTMKDHSNLLMGVQKQLDEINLTVVRQLKNQGNENKLLDREINRMHNIDRMKVAQARNSFFNPETNSLLPSLDGLNATTNTKFGSVTAGDWGDFSNIGPGGATNRMMVTTNEFGGTCERFFPGTSKPSQRNRVIITRSLEPSTAQSANKGARNGEITNINNFLNTSIKHHDDSIMSAFTPGRNSINQQHKPQTAGANINIQHNSNHSRNNTQRFNINSTGTVDIQEQKVPDAMQRIKMKQTKVNDQRSEKKRQMAINLEESRSHVLKSYNLKK